MVTPSFNVEAILKLPHPLLLYPLKAERAFQPYVVFVLALVIVFWRLRHEVVFVNRLRFLVLYAVPRRGLLGPYRTPLSSYGGRRRSLGKVVPIPRKKPLLFLLPDYP